MSTSAPSRPGDTGEGGPPWARAPGPPEPRRSHLLTSGRPAPPLGGQGSPASWSSPSVSDLSPDLRHQGPPGKIGGAPI